MLALSQTTGYAILALACLRECGNGLMLAKDIAACTGIPLPYLSKILHSLACSGLIDGKRGYRGGFALNRPMTKISFHDVAVAIEGEDYLPQCMLGLGVCLHRPNCPGQSFWRMERARIERHLKRTTLATVGRQQICSGAAGGDESCRCSELCTSTVESGPVRSAASRRRAGRIRAATSRSRS